MSPPRMPLQRVRIGVIQLANLLGVIAVVADFQCGGGQERARKLLNREADGGRRGLPRQTIIFALDCVEGCRPHAQRSPGPSVEWEAQPRSPAHGHSASWRDRFQRVDGGNAVRVPVLRRANPARFETAARLKKGLSDALEGPSRPEINSANGNAPWFRSLSLRQDQGNYSITQLGRDLVLVDEP
jgi:hypothetical protein